MRRQITTLVAAVLAIGALTSHAALAAPTGCTAALFVTTDGGGAYVVEQPDSAPGSVFCVAAPNLTFRVATAPEHGLLTALTPNGAGGASFSYIPNLGYAGSDAFVFEADDGESTPVLVPVEVSVRAAANDAPQCVATLAAPSDAGGYLVEAAEGVSGRLECFDDEGDPLNAELADAPTRGTLSALTPEQTGATFTYTAGATTGTDRFTLVADDGEIVSVPAAIELTIIDAANDPPRCIADLSTTADISDVYEVQQGKTVTALIACDDDEGDALTLAVTRAPMHGALAPLVNAGDGAVETAYTAAAGYQGTDQFRITADDGESSPTVVIVRLHVVPARDDAPHCTVDFGAPVVSGRHVVERGDIVLGHLDCVDETQQLVYSAEPVPQRGTISDIGSDGRFSYTAGNETGPDTITLVADDGAQQTHVGVPVEVVPETNDRPVCEVVIAAGTNIDGAYLLATVQSTHGRVICKDDEGDDLTFAIVVPPVHGTISGLTKDGRATAGFTYTPAVGYLGPDALAFGVSDGVNPQQVAPTDVEVVTPTPGAPHCTGRLHTASLPAGAEVEVGEAVQGTVTCLDPDGDDLTYSIASPPTGGTVTAPVPSGGAARFTYIAGNALGEDRFAVVASDGSESSNLVELDVEVVAAYDSPPECSIGLFTTPLATSAYPAQNGRPNEGVVSCVDDEGGPLSFEIVTSAQHGDLADLTGNGTFATFAYVADAGYLGADAAGVRVRDAGGGEDVVALVLEVAASPNTAPTCTATLDATQSEGRYVVAAGASAAGQLTCSDADLDAMTFIVWQAPAIGTLSAFTGSGGARQFTFSSPSGPGGTATFVLRSTDALGAVNDVTVPVTVTPTPADPDPTDPDPTDPGPTVPGPTTPGPPPPPPVAPPAPPPARPGATKPAAPRLTIAHPRPTRAQLASGIRMTITGARPKSTVTAIVKHGRLTLTRRTAKTSRTGRATITAMLKARQRKALRRGGRLTVTVTAIAPATGKKITYKRVLTVR